MASRYPGTGQVYLASDKTGNFQVVDVRRGAVIAQIPIGDDPNQMTLTKDGRFAYVPMRGEAKIAVSLDLLEQLIRTPSYTTLPLLRMDPGFDSLRDHPRFRKLMAARP